MRRTRVLLVGLWIAAALLLLPAEQVAARTFFGFGFGVPLLHPYPAYPYYYPPPPYYYPPPIYGYAPPPPYYPPYAFTPPAVGLRCHAGAYSCPLEKGERAGDACSCMTPRGPAWGRAGG